MKREQIPLVDSVTGYIIPSLSSIYRDILTSMMHVLDYTGDWHENITLDNIWLRNGSTAQRDTEMFERVINIIHDVLLPKELEFFCRILHNDVADMLSLLVNIEDT
ncbi:hypothetical protein ACE6H2_020126 [Prunus campanulata]